MMLLNIVQYLTMYTNSSFWRVDIFFMQEEKQILWSGFFNPSVKAVKNKKTSSIDRVSRFVSQFCSN